MIPEANLQNENFVEGPAWDNSAEYPAIESVEFRREVDNVAELTESIRLLVDTVRPNLRTPDIDTDTLRSLQSILIAKQDLNVLRGNLGVYVTSELAVDVANGPALIALAKLEKTGSAIGQIFNPVSHFLTVCDESILIRVLEHPRLEASKFLWQEERKRSAFLLSESEEALLGALTEPGFTAWGRLYDTLSGSLRVEIQDKGKSDFLGLSQASTMIRSADASLRERSWRGIQKAWEGQENTAASILNSIAGWRLAVDEKRSHREPVHFLDQACFNSRIEKTTLDAMLTAIENNVEDLREAGLAMARVLGKDRLDPWDILAPFPISTARKNISFADGIEMIRRAFTKLDPGMGEFVTLMVKNKWIDGRICPRKKTGAYCTSFKKSKTPRVFMSYAGNVKDVTTLAHELGHAYHAWTMRDLAPDEQQSPMTLSETASLFAETALNDALLAQARTDEEKLSFLWNAASDSINFLLNIPARFTFEKSFYEKRRERALTVDEFKRFNDEAWTRWYGPVLSENDVMYWATKLHFSITSRRFYNFPYAFGYLFGLSIYARQKAQGADFIPKYKALLLDTGRLSAEDVVQKHLGEDIRTVKFWQSAIDMVVAQNREFMAQALKYQARRS